MLTPSIYRRKQLAAAIGLLPINCLRPTRYRYRGIMPRENALVSSHHGRVDQDRRRFQRIHLQIPLFVRGVDSRGGRFVELAKTLDISALGAFLVCPCPAAKGQVITLTVPAPSISSSALVPAGMSPILAKVVRCQGVGDVHLIGAEFLKPID